MSRPRNPSFTVPRRLSRGDDDGQGHTSPRPSIGFSPNAFIRRLTVKPGLSQANTFASAAGSTGPKRRVSFQDLKFWEGVGPNGLTCVHSPDEPLVDLIFVHGLHGGSYKTWRKKEEKNYFWPGEWLSNDSEFQNVRIHTFGYAAEWSDFKSNNATVSDFGSSLYGALISSPHLSRRHKTPIVLIGHSMGGLVIKRACLMAHRQRETEVGVESLEDDTTSLASRIKCLMFLGTPHHGSDSAELLDKVLRSGLSPMSGKEYVKDLRKESPSNESINDEFRFIADSFHLFSFFEARPTSHLGFVVPKDSARINGPRHEHTQSIDADHRGMVKFENEDDPNYRILHDHLLKIVDALIGLEYEREPDKLEPLAVYLDCEESHDEAYQTTLEQRVPGTCQWIIERPDFLPWMQRPTPPVWLYWLHAPPGTGKSVMSASVISMLQSKGHDVSYFFFINGNKYHRTVAGMLRYMAFQMAQNHKEVEEEIEEMQRTGVQWSEVDEKVIWRKLFLNCIFKLDLGRTQYWVIDALDEGADTAKLWPLFKFVTTKFNFRIFMTSRTSAAIRNSFMQVGNGIQCTEDKISPDDTETDIRRLLEEKGEIIPGNSDSEKTDMLGKIVQHSQGSFLWTNIVLKEMEFAYSQADIDEILAEVPDAMVKHYEIIFNQMAARGDRNKELIQAMLIWATCCIRPLAEAEFQKALFLDIGENLATSIRRTVEGLCSQLLTINKQGAVQVVHSTVQEILFNRNYQLAYSIKREDGHRRLALACLKFLNSSEMRPEGRLHLLTETKLGNSILHRASPFADYAATSFSTHLVNSPVDNEDLFKQLLKFLRSPNALSWIDYVAQKHKSLHHIREAGANLQRYMQKRAKIVAPLGTGVSTVTSWSTDLIRVVSKFGRNILDAPSQILLLVPAMCPRNSIIHKQFANRNPEFKVLGIAEDFWADAISYIEHLGSRPTAISMGARYFGVGRESGQIHIYDNETIEQVTEFSHGEPIKALKFSISGNWLIASGSSLIKLWNLEHTAGRMEPVWTKEVEQSCLSFYFADDDETVMTVSSTSVLRIPINADMDEEDVEANVDEIPLQPPVGGDESLDKETVLHSVSFSPDGDFVAFTHDDRPISIWSATSGEYLGSCTRQAGHDASHVERLLFNLNPDLPFIVVTYKEGELGLIDYNMLREVRSVKAEPYALACTPDGHTLATGDAKGKIQLWDFETLTLIYVINYHSTSVRDLRFSKDGSRLVDLRETHSVVWEPAALLRSSDEEDSSSISGTSVSYRAPAVVEDYDDKAQITSLVLYPNKPFAIVGHDHGAVDCVNLHTGQRAGEIVTLGDSRVIQLAVHRSQLLACATSDQSIRVSLLDDDADTIKESKVLLQVDDFGERVIQVLFSESGNYFLACGERMTKVWARNSSDTDGFTLMGPSASPETDCWRYLSSHEDPDSFELIDKRIDDIVRHADAGLPGKLRRTNTMGSENHSFSRIVNALVDPGTGYLMIEYEGALATRQLLILKRTTAQPTASDSNLLSPPTSPDPTMLLPPLEGMSIDGPSQPPVTDNYRLLLHLKAYQIKMLLGVYEGKAVYLGPRLWIRTCDLHHLNGIGGQKPVKRRHFFIPHEYIGGSYHVQAMVGQEGEVVFPRRGELAVVRGGITT